ncbi:MAG TPA: response regulator, partial [Acidimicrobiia bacterium]
VREQAVQRSIRMDFEIDPGITTIEADERKVKQVVFNLLSNAVKFTPDGGRVELAARLVGDSVQVGVTDTGIGIDAADQSRIFEEFQQAGQREGSGLGLPLARSFVALHGGDLWVESEPGAGSTFTFTLPVRQTAPVPEARTPHPTGGPTVLLIEDDRRSVELLTLYLEGAGFEVITCGDGEAGLETARQLRPAAIVLDIMLPRLDGWDFLALAKGDEATAHIPVVIVSMLDERGKGFALGAADYLVKPVSRDDLLATLRRLTAAAQGNGSCTVLAIDDDPLAVELIETVLRAEGFTVVGALGGEDGVAAAKAQRPGLIILDLLMPGVDGFEVVDRLRADPATADIPVVILTSKTIEPSDRERLAAHVAHMAAKASFSRAEFVELVRRFCDRELA